jgi:glycosyltransferase involved in cell wall biosynthesis
MTNIACSQAIATDLSLPAEIIRNAYDDTVFRQAGTTRTGELIFVGRLVSDKGVDLLLQSLVLLDRKDLAPKLTVVGFGPDEAALRNYCRVHGLQDRVRFLGRRDSSEIAGLLNGHRVMVVPSRVEPFGIVALEAIACGCVVVGSDAGGLPEAIGDCGLIFGSGDVHALSLALERALHDPGMPARMAACREAHLAHFRRREVAKRYLAAIERALAGRRG